MIADNFTMIPHILLDTEALNLKEKMIYIELFRYLPFGKTSGLVFPSMKTLAKQAGITTRTVITIIESLVEKHFISKQRRKNTSNLYFINDIYEVLGFTRNLAKPVPQETEENPCVNCDQCSHKAPEQAEQRHNENIHTEKSSPKQKKEVAEISQEALEQAKEQISYDDLMETNAEHEAIINDIVEIIAEEPQRHEQINTNMVRHIIKKFMRRKNIEYSKAYLRTMVINQPKDEPMDCLNDLREAQPVTQERRLASPNNRFHNFQQRQYNYEELNARILNRDI